MKKLRHRSNSDSSLKKNLLWTPFEIVTFSQSMPRYCGGLPGVPCMFATRPIPGQPARVRRGFTHCNLRDAAELALVFNAPARKKILLGHIKAMPPDIQAAAVQRIPAEHRQDVESQLKKSKYCPGAGGHACCFSSSGRAVQMHGRGGKCWFCNVINFRNACADPDGRLYIIKQLKRCTPEARAFAIAERVPEAHRTEIESALAQFQDMQFGTRKHRADVVDINTVRGRWVKALECRRRVGRGWGAVEKKQYREQVLADRRRGRARMQQPPARVQRNAAVSNDVDLPPAKRSPLAILHERWCRFASWGMCETCNGLNPRELTDATLQLDHYPQISESNCKFCTAKRRLHLLSSSDVPVELVGLSEETQKALALVEIDVGSEVRARDYGNDTGYRQKTSMCRFRWCASRPRDRLNLLADADQRRKGSLALEYLRGSDLCNYEEFFQEHALFLNNNPDADERTRLRRLMFIERIGLETAVWPCWFWELGACFTYEKATDVRRTGPEDEDDEEDRDEQDEGEDGSRHSTKRLFVAKAMGPLLGHVNNFEVLQFAYDHNLWTSLCSKKLLNQGIPMRIMMRGHSFSPLYWRSVHAGLTDLVRQIGLPKIFWTMSPYVWSFPMHEWVLDEMTKELRGRLYLPIAEVLHMTHAIMETIRVLIAGAKEGTTQRIFNPVDEEGKAHKIHFVSRVEFQDGSRKAPTQSYHGSGLPHVHVLFFFSDEAFPLLKLEQHVSVTRDGHDEDMRGYIVGSQCGRRRGPWQVHDGDEGWDKDARCLRLKHTVGDHGEGVRACILDIMDVMKCHQDLQVAHDDAGILRAYVTKYVAKFSDAAQDEWLNDHAEATNMAATVLLRYHPYEPEMILQLCGAKYRQWDVSTISRGKRAFLAPVPDDEELSQEVALYMAAPWAAGRISLIDFLRKTTSKGKICNWLQKLHAQSETVDSLEDFAAGYQMAGEKIVAAEFLSRFNDRFHGQWLMTFVPFKDPAEFVDEAELEKIPNAFRYFAMLRMCKNPAAVAVWDSPDAVAAEMRLEGHTQHHIDTILNSLQANGGLVDAYLAGRRNAAEEERQRQERVQNSGNHGADAQECTDWTAMQVEYMNVLGKAIDRAIAVQCGEDEEAADEARRDADEHGKIVACFGAPGTGKTTATFKMIQHTLDKGGDVLMALPTAQLASRMRERWGTRITIDTCAAAFGFMEKNNPSNLSNLSIYSLVVVDEISQLEGWQADLIVKLWKMTEKVTAVALVGDKGQMAGFGDVRPWHSRLWKTNVWPIHLREVHRRKDPDYQIVLDTLRTAQPDDEMLRELKKNVIWGREPSVTAVRKLLRAHPETTVLTCSRWGAHSVNVCALKALFPRFPPRSVISGDVESNPENYIKGKMKGFKDLVPTRLQIFIGMKVYTTRNVRKDIDFVNGMRAEVTGFTAATGAVEVLTSTGHRFSVYPWTDTDMGNITYYPLRAGYASTVLKFQGTELKHVTVFLDAQNVPGAAYTAMSRVSYGKDLVLAGMLTADHFCPAL